MSKKTKFILLIYIIVSLMDSIGGWTYQKYEYSVGQGYTMTDLSSFAFFFIFTVLYTLVWYREVERKSQKITWYIYIIAVIAMFLFGTLIWHI